MPEKKLEARSVVLSPASKPSSEDMGFLVVSYHKPL